MNALSTRPNASAISRMISSAGFRKASEGTTRIPGYHVFTEGFKVENGSASVRVRYEFASSNRNDLGAAKIRRDEVMTAIVALLRSKGYEVITSALQPDFILVKKAVA